MKIREFNMVAEQVYCIRRLLENQNNGYSIFEATDSSFRLDFIKHKNQIKIHHKKDVLIADIFNFSLTFYNAVREFLLKYTLYIENSSVIKDLQDELCELEVALKRCNGQK